MFADLSIESLEQWHEEVLADPSGAVGQVADYVGVGIDSSAEVEVPPTNKQSPGESAEWITRYSRARQSSSS